MASRSKLVLALGILLAAAAMIALILPVLAASGDYGVNTGANTTCPPGYNWVADPSSTTGGSCVWDGVTTLTPTPVTPTATPSPTQPSRGR